MPNEIAVRSTLSHFTDDAGPQYSAESPSFDATDVWSSLDEELGDAFALAFDSGGEA